MKAIIPPQSYCSKEIFDSENLYIFEKCWNYIGNLSDFKNTNDFISLSIAGVPIVVQNVKGTIKAFKNICSHRHSLLQTEAFGNRQLMCPYHGWSYNENGIPKGIPKKPLFDFSEGDLECLKLKQYKIEFCGNFVFINLSDSSDSLYEYLGSGFFAEIEKISNSLGEQVDYNEMKIQANWKILVENTLESYHVNLIHTNSFMRLGANGLNFQFFNNHSVWNANLKLSENEGVQEKIHRPFQNRPFKIGGYKHILVFPNLLISTTYGISFNISLISPVNESNSIFKSFVFLTASENESNSNSAIKNMYRDSLIDFNRNVFNEDKEICEKVQFGVKHSHFSGELSDEEERVCEFQKAYNQYISQH